MDENESELGSGMTELLTSRQMRALEQQAIASGSVTGLVLMERAGRRAVDAIFTHWPVLASGAHRAVVLCGPGNNGGDGFVVARRLHDKGWSVETLFWGDPASLSQDARKTHDLLAAMTDIHVLSARRAGQGMRPALLVDALFGTGLTRAMPAELLEAFHAVELRAGSEPLYKVALDCPSGVDSDSGKLLLPPKSDGSDDGCACGVSVDLTLAFHRRKIAHALGCGLGQVRVIDIGLGARTLYSAEARSCEIAVSLDFWHLDEATGHIFSGPDLDKGHAQGRHKFDHGHALILSGAVGKTGAARLAARGALRIGAGLVTLGAPRTAQAEIAAQITGLMLHRVQSGDDLAALLQDARINALCLGPGMGLARARRLVPVALNARHQPSVVLDADALSAFSGAPSNLFDMLHPRCVLTPHGGEFARLFPDIAKALDAPAVTGPAFSKADAARQAARRAGCIVLLKGAETVIASPEGDCSVHIARNERAAPWLATAGAGDVLAGFITGLLARDFGPLQAAEVATWLHVECALTFGPGLIAEDLPEALPAVLRSIV